MKEQFFFAESWALEKWERRGMVKKKKLHFAFQLPSLSGIDGERSCPLQEQGASVGKDRYPHPHLPTTD